jgi:hypothetical protein
MPYAEANGIELVELSKRMKDGSVETIIGRINRRPASVPIPLKMGVGGPPASRACTADFKIGVIEKELRRRGATKDEKATVGLGISIDEVDRAGTKIDPNSDYQLREYPLIDLDIARDQCATIIRSAGLPVPPRSACFFCPNHKDEEWRKLARDEPALFEESCQLEEELHRRGKVLQAKRIAEGERPGGDFYFTRHGVFLRDLFHGNDLTLFTDLPDDGPGCVAGYCHT